MHRRIRRYPLIDFDRKLWLLDIFVNVREREQRHWMAGRQIKRKLQINQPKVLPAAPAQCCAQPIEHLGGTRLRRIDH